MFHSEWYRNEVKRISDEYRKGTYIPLDSPIVEKVAFQLAVQRYLHEAVKSSLYKKDLYEKYFMEGFGKTMSMKEIQATFPGTGQPQLALYEKRRVIALGKAKSWEPACFAAGTLVHTKEGLKPIEQIKVGDWVLSRHESGEGEREYKRVTNTISHEDRQVLDLMLLRYPSPDADGERDHLAVTPEHPIWVNGKGWIEVGKLRSTRLPIDFNLVDLPSGWRQSFNVFRMFRTADPSVAWVPGSHSDELTSLGVNFNVQSMQVIQYSVANTFKGNRVRVTPALLYRTTVFNLEVEDFHTYYVGRFGVLVHNTKIGLKQGNGGPAPSANLVNNALYSTGEANGLIRRAARDAGKEVESLAEFKAFIEKYTPDKSGVLLI